MVRILLVDDEEGVCDFVVSFFKERNFEIFSAKTTNDAIQVLKNKRPDIILLEIKTENMSGLELLRQIGNDNRYGKVVVISRVDDPDIVNEAKKLGAIAYLTKPISLGELMDTVLINIGREPTFFSLKRSARGI